MGGGLCISSCDHARFGLLLSRDGLWSGGKSILPSGWMGKALKPCELNHQYGFMIWLNVPGTKGLLLPAAREGSFFARGAGGNVIWCDKSLDLVVVVRWCGDVNGFIQKVMDASLI